MATGCHSSPKQPIEIDTTRYVSAGDNFPIASISNLKGETVNLHNPDKNKVVILFATWCHDSNRLIKALEKTQILKDNNIEVIAISKMESSNTVNAWQKDNNIKTQLALDTTGEIYKQFALTGLPRIVTIGKDNTVISSELADDANPKKQLAKIIWTL